MYQVYEVLDGDTLDSISLKMNISSDELCRLNGTNNFIPGDYIVVPSTDDLYFSYIIKPGDTLYSVSKMYNINPSILSFINGLDDVDFIYPSQSLMIPKDGIEVYVTKEGDSFKSILNNSGISSDSLIDSVSDLYFVPDQLVLYKRD